MKNFLKPFRLLTLLILVFLLFKDSIEVIYDKKIITPILSKAQSSIVLDLFIIILLILGVIYFIIPKIQKGYYIKPQQVITSIVILLGCLYYRINDSYNYLSFEMVKNIKYFDVIFIILLTPIVLYIIRLFTKNIQKTNSNVLFLDDSEIEFPEHDFLSRTNLANNLFNQITTIKSQKSIAFGITGEWGSGKTSFINLIKRNFDNDKHKDNYIIIDYDPWLNIKIESIIQNFFDSVESKIREYSLEISKDIRKYGESVVSIDGSGVIDSALKNLSIIQKDSLTQEFDKINKLLKKLDKKIIVFIDDFDRLQANEIMEVLKLIRNTAGFDNFTYIVAFDKEYLTKSLKSIKIPFPDKYSEKIFVNEIKLLPVTYEQKQEFLKSSLLTHFPEKEEEIKGLLDKEYTIFYSQYNKTLIECLTNVRDLKRFLNLFFTNYQKIREEVVLRDYFVLQLLKFKYYDIYLLLFKRKGDFLISKHSHTKGNSQDKLSLKQKKEKGFNNNYKIDFEESEFRGYIIEKMINKEEDLDSIGRLLNILFPKYNSMVEGLSICYSINYYKYFKEELDEKSLSKPEFDKAFSLPLIDLEEIILKWDKENKIDNVKFYFYDIDPISLKDREEYEKYIESSFFIGNLNKNMEFFNGFDLAILWEATIGKENVVIEKYYNNKTGGFREFLFRLLNINDNLFDCQLKYCLYADELLMTDSKTLKKDEIRQFVIHYFRNYASTTNTQGDRFWYLFNCCKFINYTTIDGMRYEDKKEFQKEAKEIFKEFIVKDLDNFLMDFIDTQSFYNRKGNNDNKVFLSTTIPIIFGSYDNFEKLLKSQKFKNSLVRPSLFLDEFLQFMKEMKKADPTYKTIIPDVNLTFPPLLERLEKVSKNNY